MTVVCRFRAYGRRIRFIAFTAALVSIFLAALTLPANASAESSWRWPVDGEVLTRFVTIADPFAAGQHRGIDIAAGPGTAVRAPCSGRVRFAGTAGNAGRTVSVECGDLVASFLHLSRIAVRKGLHVAAGDPLGAAGTTGRRSHPRPHLHFGVRRRDERFSYLDPLSLLRDARRRLVPPVGGGSRRFIPVLGPGPRGVRVPSRSPRPVVVRPAARPVGVVTATPAALPPVPLPVWAGLAALAAALPGWGLQRARLRRRRGLRARRAGERTVTETR